MIFGKLIAAVMIGIVLLVLLRRWALVIVGIFVLLWLIRFFAYIFWWGKDNNKW